MIHGVWGKLRAWCRQRPARTPSVVRPGLEQLEARDVPSTLTFVADADASVSRSHARSNFGSASELRADLSPSNETYLRFTLDGVVGPIESARVRLYVTDGSSNGPEIYAASNNWTESGITWQNRPGRTGGLLDDKGRVGTGWQEFDVTARINGDGTYSFVLMADSSDGLYMAAREQGRLAPQLVVTFAGTPQPLQVNAGPDLTGQAGTPLTLSGLGSGGTGPFAFAWDLGDGQVLSTSPSFTHVFATSGVYSVRLTVTDATGQQQTDTVLITVTEAPPAPPPSPVGQRWSSPRQVGTLNTSQIDESSGLAVSRAYPGRLYHINDSGDGGYFYVTDAQGQNTQRVRVNGFSPSDAEDLAYGSFGGKNYLIIGDIGDNGASRGSITLVFIEERAAFGSSVDAAFRITVRYPDGAHNAEAMALHPSGDLYIMTKESTSRIYRLSAAQWQNAGGQTQTLQYVGSFSLASQTGSSSITSFDIAPDGSRLLILTYDGAMELEARLVNGVLDFSRYGRSGGPAYKVIPLTVLPQQESVSYLPNGLDFLYTTEYHSETVPILQVDRLG